MSFRTQALLADDYSLQRRLAACAAKEGVPDPMGWVQARAWTLSAQPGWDAAYQSAVEVGNASPGSTDTVITDGMILSAVQSLRDTGVTDAIPDPQTPAAG